MGGGGAISRQHDRGRDPATPQRAVREHVHQGERHGDRPRAVAVAAVVLLRAAARGQRAARDPGRSVWADAHDGAETHGERRRGARVNGVRFRKGGDRSHQRRPRPRESKLRAVRGARARVLRRGQARERGDGTAVRVRAVSERARGSDRSAREVRQGVRRRRGAHDPGDRRPGRDATARGGPILRASDRVPPRDIRRDARRRKRRSGRRPDPRILA
mmetsp:Transcript_14934/g.53752  ORF Transcript_14934/g.53752 Transcript_14934/m.53752 type:complete len:217 (+) Transcript_14934:331-981(+)